MKKWILIVMMVVMITSFAPAQEFVGNMWGNDEMVYQFFEDGTYEFVSEEVYVWGTYERGNDQIILSFNETWMAQSEYMDISFMEPDVVSHKKRYDGRVYLDNQTVKNLGKASKNSLEEVKNKEMHPKLLEVYIDG